MTNSRVAFLPRPCSRNDGYSLRSIVSNMSRVAVVTGATGYVATQVVKQLLEKGYTVKGTVRSTTSDKVKGLKALGEALPGALSLHEADLLKPGAFDGIVKGASVVFHLASPFFQGAKDPQTELVDPAVKGTKNVLEAVAKSLDTVKRVVLTSSFAAVVKSKSGPSNGSLYNEEDWNTDSELQSDGYRYSKVTAEKLAWEISKEHGIDLVTILPTLVIGPVLGPRADATSILNVKDLLEGKKESLIPWLVDVRDIGRAHVLAAETPEAKGRYIVSNNRTIGSARLFKALKAEFPQYAIPEAKEEESKQILDDPLKVTKELGLQITPPEESIVDMVRTMVAEGIVKPKLA